METTHTQVRSGPRDVLEHSPPASLSRPQASWSRQYQLTARITFLEPFLLPSPSLHLHTLLTLSWGGEANLLLRVTVLAPSSLALENRHLVGAHLGPAFSGNPPSLSSCPPGLWAAAAGGGRNRAQLPCSAVRHAVAVLSHLPHLRAR